MEEDEGGPRLSKRFSDKEGGEVDYNTKSGTAWSHSYLNQKPWHPLSYPNQRRKWIAEQTHAHRQRRSEEVAREYAQEQDFLRQTSLLSQKEKEKVDMMQAVSFMYVRPPGYNAESAKAAEISDERRKLGEGDPNAASSSSMPQVAVPVKEEKKKSRPKDIFGRTLPTEEEFAVLKNAPRLETGVAGRVKPFAVEVRNVKCVRCGSFGHQSGDRECPLKDAIMPNDESRLKRDDPLTAIIAHMDSSEPLKWELKQKPGISLPHGGFMPDDPNQQIVAEDIFDEYGGFLSGGDIPELLTNFSFKKHKKSKSKTKQPSSKQSHEDGNLTSDSDDDQRNSKTKLKSKSRHKKRALSKRIDEENDTSGNNRRGRTSRRNEKLHKNKKSKELSHSSMSEDSESERYEGEKRALPRHSNEDNGSRRKERSYKRKSVSEDSESGIHHGKSRQKHSHRSKHLDSDKHHGLSRRKESRISHEDSLSDGERKLRKKGKTHRSHRTTRNDSELSSSETSGYERYRDRRHKCSYSFYDSDSDVHHRRLQDRHPHYHHRHSTRM